MALEKAIGSFATGTGTGALSKINLSFEAKVILFFVVGGTTAGTIRAAAKFGFGAADANGAAAVGWGEPDNNATTNSGCTTRSDAALATVTNNTTLDGLFTVAIAADGFTVTITDAFSASLLVGYLALGGADITDVKVGTFSASTDAVATQDVTDPGFQPDLLFLFGSAATTINALAASGRISLGVVTAGELASVGLASQHNVTTTVTSSITSTTQAFTNRTAGADTVVDEIGSVSFLSNGFRISRTVGTSNLQMGYVAIKGIQAKLLQVASRTDTNTTGVTGAGFTPLLAFFFSGCNATAAETSYNPDGRIGLGVSDGTTHRSGAVCIGDNLSGSDAAGLFTTNRAWSSIKRTAADTFSVQADADVDSMDSDGLTWDQITADSQATLVHALLIGAAAGGGGGTPLALLNNLSRQWWN